MAEMIPDSLPSNASAGEKKVFSLLQQLPDDVIVYYEAVIAKRYPDFIVILPSLGVLIIEAKGWYPAHILSGNTTDVKISSGGKTEMQKHPVRQARDYKFQLMDLAKAHPQTATLLHSSGDFQGRPIFPFGHVAFLNNCTRAQLDERGLSVIFPSSQNVARDEMEALALYDADQLMAKFKDYFDPWFPFDPLGTEQVNSLRSIIHPEVVISPAAPAEKRDVVSLMVMDIRQERNARSLGEGHRVIYGVAGSGKTVILIARAKLIAAHKDKKCLILCFNKDLAKYFRRVFEHARNVECRHFHDWGGANGAKYKNQESEEDYGMRLVAMLNNGSIDFGAFDAVFIDEAQDFAQSWFQSAKLALKEPDDGDLLIVGDGTQKVYKRRPFSWKSSGIQAQGRTINKKFDLDRNYRNTKEVLQLASAFVRVTADNVDPDSSTQIIVPDVGLCIRNGHAPEVAIAHSFEHECQTIGEKITNWVNNGVAPCNIAILYRANTKQWVNTLAGQLSKNVPVNWQKSPNKELSEVGGIVFTTMHSAKGLQWQNVIIARANTMPFIPDQTGDIVELENFERGLMYVAMTRAEEELFITASSNTGFACEIFELNMQLSGNR